MLHCIAKLHNSCRKTCRSLDAGRLVDSATVPGSRQGKIQLHQRHARASKDSSSMVASMPELCGAKYGIPFQFPQCMGPFQVLDSESSPKIRSTCRWRLCSKPLSTFCTAHIRVTTTATPILFFIYAENS
jgi:hypothetical protein